MGSLIIAGYDVMSSDSPVRYADLDLGAGAPATQAVARLLLDGDVIVGSRTGNRPIVLPLRIHGATLADRVRIFNDLARQVDGPSWSMPWTPDGLPTVVFDCFRGVAVRDWSTYASNPGVLFATLQFEAAPFPRSQGLQSEAVVVMPATLALHPFSTGTPTLASTGGWTDPTANTPTSGDTAPGVVGAATTLSGQPARTVTAYAIGRASNTWQFAPTVGAAFTAPVDLSVYRRVTFSCSLPGALTAEAMFDQAWVPLAEQDLALRANSGYWALQFTDGAGRRALSRVNASLVSGIAQVAVGFDADSVRDAGFDWSNVVSWRLRLYAGWTASSSFVSGSPELFPASQTWSVVAGPGTASGNQIFVNAGTEAACTTLPSVVAGKTYAATVNAFFPGAALGTGKMLQVGITWFNSSSAQIGAILWGSAVDSALPASVSGQAPVGAVTAQLRIRFVSGISGQYVNVEAHMLEGATPWRYPSSGFQGLTITVSQPVATGVAYRSLTWGDTVGAARSPVGVSIDCGSTAAKRVLLVRAPASAVGFTPFLDVPDDGAGVSDATALSGQYRVLPAGASGAPYYVRLAQSYSGHYALIARLRRTASTDVTVTVASLGSAQPAARTFAAADTDLSVNSWRMVTLGSLALPPQAAGPSNSVSTFTVQVYASVANLVQFDLLALVPLDGEWVYVNSPTAYRYWWLTAPSSTDRSGTMLAGSLADQSNAVSVAAYKSGNAVIHFDPGTGSNTIAVLFDQAGAGSVATVSYYPRWFGEAEA